MKLLQYPLFFLLFIVLVRCNPQDRDTIRIGLNPWPGYDYLYLAEALNYFEDEGVDVQLIELLSLGDVRRAFERGQIDAFGATLVEVLLVGELSERNASIFFVTDYSSGSDMLLAKPDITELAQLKGKRIAVEPASLDVIVVNHALSTVGLELDDVELVLLSQQEMPEALAQGDVDAVQTYPPVAVDILENQTVSRVFDTSKAPELVLDVLAADHDLLHANSEDFTKVIRAFNRAMEYVKDNPQVALPMLAEQNGMSLAQYRAAIMGVEIIPLAAQSHFFDDGQLMKVLEFTNESMRQAGMLQKRLLLETLVNPGPIAKALSE